MKSHLLPISIFYFGRCLWLKNISQKLSNAIVEMICFSLTKRNFLEKVKNDIISKGKKLAIYGLKV
jgi:hypothetical protein